MDQLEHYISFFCNHQNFIDLTNFVSSSSLRWVVFASTAQGKDLIKQTTLGHLVFIKKIAIASQGVQFNKLEDLRDEFKFVVQLHACNRKRFKDLVIYPQRQKVYQFLMGLE